VGHEAFGALDLDRYLVTCTDNLDDLVASRFVVPVFRAYGIHDVIHYSPSNENLTAARGPLPARKRRRNGRVPERNREVFAKALHAVRELSLYEGLPRQDHLL